VRADLSRGARRALGNLRRSVTRRPVGLALSGGGSQGSFQAGVLRFLYDEVRVRPSVVCGSSVGAINGAKLAEGDDPGSGRRAIDELVAIWHGLQDNGDLWIADPWLEKLRGHSAWASEMRGRAAEHGAAGSQARVVLRMLGEMVRNPPDADGTLEAVRQALRARSLLRNDPIRAMLEARLVPERIPSSGITLRIGAVCLETGELRYVTERGELLGRDGSRRNGDPVSIVDAAVASSSIPVIFPPARLGEEHYVDAGVREILPVEPAVGLVGASGLVFAVVASAPGVEPIADVENRGLLDLARRVSSDIAPDETLVKDMEPPIGWRGRLEMVAPEFDVHDVLTVDRTLIGASLDYGYLRAADVLLELGDEERMLTAEITRSRMRLRDLEGPVPGPFVTTEPEELTDAECQERRFAELDGLARLVEQRASMGAPLPPGGCGVRTDALRG